MAIHSSVLAWRIPGTGEPGGLPSMGSHRVGHNWSDLAAAAAAAVCMRGHRGWDGWIASLTQCTWVWANSRRQWRIGKLGVPQSMGLQMVRLDLETEWQQQCVEYLLIIKKKVFCSRKKVKVAQSCPTVCDPRDYSVLGILQARILEWVAFPFSRESSQLRDRTRVSCIAGRFFTSGAIREAL